MAKFRSRARHAFATTLSTLTALVAAIVRWFTKQDTDSDISDDDMDDMYGRNEKRVIRPGMHSGARHTMSSTLKSHSHTPPLPPRSSSSSSANWTPYEQGMSHMGPTRRPIGIIRRIQFLWTTTRSSMSSVFPYPTMSTTDIHYRHQHSGATAQHNLIHQRSTPTSRPFGMLDNESLTIISVVAVNEPDSFTLGGDDYDTSKFDSRQSSRSTVDYNVVGQDGFHVIPVSVKSVVHGRFSTTPHATRHQPTGATTTTDPTPHIRDTDHSNLLSTRINHQLALQKQQYLDMAKRQHQIDSASTHDTIAVGHQHTPVLDQPYYDDIAAQHHHHQKQISKHHHKEHHHKKHRDADVPLDHAQYEAPSSISVSPIFASKFVGSTTNHM